MPSFLLGVTLALAALKLDDLIDWSWVKVCSPILGMMVITAVVLVLKIIYNIIERYAE